MLYFYEPNSLSSLPDQVKLKNLQSVVNSFRPRKTVMSFDSKYVIGFWKNLTKVEKETIKSLTNQLFQHKNKELDQCIWVFDDQNFIGFKSEVVEDEMIELVLMGQSQKSPTAENTCSNFLKIIFSVMK